MAPGLTPTEPFGALATYTYTPYTLTVGCMLAKECGMRGEKLLAEIEVFSAEMAKDPNLTEAQKQFLAESMERHKQDIIASQSVRWMPGAE